jgi:hypothetical protein
MAGKGAPKGHKYNVTHGLALVRNQIKRRTKRGRSYVDKRTHEGQAALQLQAQLLDDSGGVEAITAARLIAIQELTQTYYLGAMMDHATAAFLNRHPEYKNPRALARLFSYRMPVSNTIAKYLDVLGLERREVTQTLDEILNEDQDQEGQE